MTLVTRLVACLLGVLLMLATLTACGGDDEGGASDSGSDSSAESADEPTDESADEPTDEPADEPTEQSADGSGGAYCASLKDARDRLQALEGQGGGTADFEEAIGALRDISEQAPASVAGDWRILIGGFDTLVQALDEAGLSLEDLSDPEAMGDIDPQELQQLQDQIGSLDSKKFQQAADSISSHARSECGFTLEGGA